MTVLQCVCRNMTHNHRCRGGWEQGRWFVWGRCSADTVPPDKTCMPDNFFLFVFFFFFFLFVSKHHSLSVEFPKVAVKWNPPEIGRLESSLSLCASEASATGRGGSWFLLFPRSHDRASPPRFCRSPGRQKRGRARWLHSDTLHSFEE